MNNKAFISVYLVIILSLIILISSTLIYKSNNLIETANDYKESYSKFYNDEVLLYETFYDTKSLEKDCSDLIRENPYIDTGYIKTDSGGITFKSKFIKDKGKYFGKLYSEGFTENNTKFESVMSIIDEVFTLETSYINYDTYDNYKLDKFFYEYKNGISNNFKRSSDDLIKTVYNKNENLNTCADYKVRNFINCNETIIYEDTIDSNDKVYKGLLYVKGDLIIKSNFKILGILIIEDGKIIIENDSNLEIYGGLVNNDKQDMQKGLILHEDSFNKLYYGAYAPNYVKIEPVLIKIY